MRSQEIALIRHLPLFADVASDQLPDLLATTQIQTIPRDAHLFHQGDHPSFLHILIEGTVELFAVSVDGQETTIDILSPVEAFVLAAVLLDTTYLMGAKVLDSARLLYMPARHLRAEISRQPKLALTMLASMAGQFRTMVRQIKDLKLRTATQRLAACLLRLHRRQGHADGHIVLPVSKRVLAARLNMAPENLSRALATLRDHGVVGHGQTLTLANIEALEAYCLPDALIDDDERPSA